MQNFVNRKIELAIDQLREAKEEMYEEIKNTRDRKRYNIIDRKIKHICSIIAQLEFFDYIYIG